MATEKMLPCCARMQGQLHSEEANLRRLAQKAAANDARARNIDKFKAQIEVQKSNIAALKGRIEDHDADHAGGLL